MIKMIAAVSINGIIGIDNQIPWMGRYPDDMKFFRQMTKDSIVVMGRRTFESMGSKPLPKRENRVITSGCAVDVMNTTPLYSFDTIRDALDFPNPDNKDIWLIGGEGIYREAVENRLADEIYITLIPETINTTDKTVARFPFVHPIAFDRDIRQMHELADVKNEQHLSVAIYRPSKTVWF